MLRAGEHADGFRGELGDGGELLAGGPGAVGGVEGAVVVLATGLEFPEDRVGGTGSG